MADETLLPSWPEGRGRGAAGTEVRAVASHVSRHQATLGGAEPLSSEDMPGFD